jgi:hypothetical protein
MIQPSCTSVMSIGQSYAAARALRVKREWRIQHYERSLPVCARTCPKTFSRVPGLYIGAALSTLPNPETALQDTIELSPASASCE